MGLAASPLSGQAEIFRFDGPQFANQYGTHVDAAGDVNADGVDDILITEAGGHPATPGTVFVHSGVDGTEVFSVGGDFFLQASTAGDMNGDGHDDVLITFPSLGVVRAFSGLDESLLYSFTSSGLPNETIGTGISDAGDVDGDGFGDVVIGGSILFGPGFARVYSGCDGSQLHQFDGHAALDGFGRSCKGAGDVDNDGFDDVILGSNANFLEVRSGADGSLLHSLNGSGSFGSAVDGVGDLDGDGFADFIAGSPGGLVGSVPAGFAQVFSGQDGSELFRVEGA